jgi:CPA1 family monovalent cation:H+ antiporter
MRGADSLVIALALPIMTAAGRGFPARDAIVFVTFAVILVTLVAQGLTLTPLIHLLGIDRLTSGEEAEEERIARDRIEKAGVARLDQIIRRNPTLAKAARHLRSHHVKPFRDDEEAVSRVRADMITAERRELVRLRDRGVIGDDVMRHIQRDLDLEQLLVDTGDETLE